MNPDADRLTHRETFQYYNEHFHRYRTSGESVSITTTDRPEQYRDRAVLAEKYPRIQFDVGPPIGRRTVKRAPSDAFGDGTEEPADDEDEERREARMQLRDFNNWFQSPVSNPYIRMLTSLLISAAGIS